MTDSKADAPTKTTATKEKTTKAASKAPAKKAAPKKANTDKQSVKKEAPAKKAAAKPRSKKASATAAAQISHEERSRLIAEAAYYKAAARNFAAGDSVRDWLDAEAEIDAQYSTGA